MPHKGGSKITWLKLWINLENFEEESQVEGVQTTLDALSESIQHGIKVGSLHVLVDFWRWLVPESNMVWWKMVCPETVSKQADMSILGAFESPHSYWVQAGSWRESDGLGGDCRWANPPCCLVPGISKFERIPRTSPQEYCLAISEELGNTTTILVQHDGASCHVTAECLDFLHAKFGERIISRRTIHHWPPYSPDLSPLDFSFWSQAIAHITRCEPSTLTELKKIVEDFAADMREKIFGRWCNIPRKEQSCAKIILVGISNICWKKHKCPDPGWLSISWSFWFFANKYF